MSDSLNPHVLPLHPQRAQVQYIKEIILRFVLSCKQSNEQFIPIGSHQWITYIGNREYIEDLDYKWAVTTIRRKDFNALVDKFKNDKDLIQWLIGYWFPKEEIK